MSESIGQITVPDSVSRASQGPAVVQASIAANLRSSAELFQSPQFTCRQLVVLSAEALERDPIFHAVERLYTSRLVPDHNIVAMAQRNNEVLHGFKGGMYNRFSPTANERGRYPQGYQSPKEQMIAELSGQSQRPGVHRLYYVTDDDDRVVGFTTMHLPPLDEAGNDKYVQYLQEQLLGEQQGERFALQESVMNYELTWKCRKMLDEQFHSMGEVDTIVVEERKGAAAFVLLYEALCALAKENILPRSFYGFRFDGAVPVEVQHQFGTQVLPVGKNDMGQLFHQQVLGWQPFATKFDPDKRVVREIDDSGSRRIIELVPQWKYIYISSNDLICNLQKQLRNRGLDA